MKNNISLILTTIIVSLVIFNGSAWADDAAVKEAVFYVQ